MSTPQAPKYRGVGAPNDILRYMPVAASMGKSCTEQLAEAGALPARYIPVTLARLQHWAGLRVMQQ